MDIKETIQKHATELLEKMISNVTVEVTEENGMYQVLIKTEDDAPTVIGRHGETIRAIQKILEVILFKEVGEPVGILINVNDYREKQIERLEYIADQAVDKVRQRQTATYLRGFSSYERRVMHEKIAKEYPDLSSYSVGEDRDRRLVVDLAGAKPEEEESEE